jgi:hypothetical protein
MARVAWGNRGAKINQLLREFGVEVPYLVPDMADIAREGEGEKEEGEEKTATRHTKRDDLPITKRRRHAKQVRASRSSAK